ncbi:hypothetical protein RI845_04430 [Thalassotalea nanhaiensis]|uniref:Uncharacterized protein n=1 Tax=Thalassotalea nanhaiensis TaxID=3065648 RepID=A0ABY9TKS4_9GAMM|nr:hypothetical protein RI845_04430 [Colwelliaceae bacterium SQ345]
MDIIKNNFNGKNKLWQVFWIQNILIGAILNFSVENIAPGLGHFSIILLIVFSIAYSIWVAVGMWQCAFNASWVGWGYIVRGLLIAVILIILVSSVSLAMNYNT